MSACDDRTDVRRERAAGISLLRRAGAGVLPTIVFLHGIGSEASSWTPLLGALDPEFDALAWDAPGYRDSDPLETVSPMAHDYGLALAAMLDQLDLRRIILVGHSLGSLFAGCFAAKYPGRVAALALLSPALGYGAPAGRPLPPNLQARIDDLERLGPSAFAARNAPRLVFCPDDEPDLVARIEASMAAVRPRGYAQAVRALGAGDLLEVAPAIAAPTLVVVGAQDTTTPPQNARRLYEALAHPAPFRLVPNVGHALPQQAPRETARLLASFLRTSAHV